LELGIFKGLKNLPLEIRQYILVTANYWAFTLTDGALRMLVVLYFYGLGYSPLEIAMLFIFYEVFGVITNLIGGWLGARLGLNKTMNIGLFMQICALLMLTVPATMLSVPWVMAAQALSGIAKDLNKMSAKSAIKSLVPSGEQGRLYKWVALLTGSKNTLKGAGFFLGGFLLTLIGFQSALLVMAGALGLVWVFSVLRLRQDLGKAKNKPKFKDIFSKSRAINVLSAARMFLFGARDVWFVVALPVYLASHFDWDHSYVGAFLALWIMAYGAVQTFAPNITKTEQSNDAGARDAVFWALALGLVSAAIATSISLAWFADIGLIVGLMVFGVVFAINSSLHSFLIVHYADADGVSLDVGFYYMANALGRLLGTVLSGWIYQEYGLAACLWVSTLFVVFTVGISTVLPKINCKADG